MSHVSHVLNVAKLLQREPLEMKPQKERCQYGLEESKRKHYLRDFILEIQRTPFPKSWKKLHLCFRDTDTVIYL